ncbi:MAG TPA: pentapeptide repeat-containing protein [Gaiellaceae bacterium]
MSTGLLAAAAVAAIVVASFLIWLVPNLEVARWRRAGIDDEEKLAALGLQARTAITQALGGLALIVTIALTAYQAIEARRSADRSAEAAKTTADKTQRTANKNLEVATRNLKLTEQAQNAERFSRAIEGLGANDDGSPAIDVRVGALFSLMKVALGSKQDEEPVLNVAAAYVVDNYKKPARLANDGCDAAFALRNQPDVRVALAFVLPKVAKKRLRRTQELILGFRSARLDGLAFDRLTLRGFDLSNVKFPSASLNRADFRGSQLVGASFDRACLQRADFRGANLGGADFDRATLTGAKFDEADLKHASLSPMQRNTIKIIAPWVH